jgi:predicted MFS family arabinose efflux permease
MQCIYRDKRVVGVFVHWRKKFSERPNTTVLEVASVFKDKIFWIFLFVSFVTAMIFFQLFTTLPLYHSEQFGLTEFQTGLLMTLNGLLIFALEMPFVGYFERKSTETEIILWGVYLCLLAFTCYQYLGRNTNY